MKKFEWALRNNVPTEFLKREEKVDTASMRFGRIVHELLANITLDSDVISRSDKYSPLQNKVIDALITSPDEEFANVYAQFYKTKCAPDMQEELIDYALTVSNVKYLVSQTDYDKIFKCVNSVRACTAYNALASIYNDVPPDVYYGCEVELYAQPTINNEVLPLKGMLDLVLYSEEYGYAILDYKTHGQSFQKSVSDNDYVRQLAFYKYLLHVKTGVPLKRISTFLVSIDTSNYKSSVVSPSGYDMQCAIKGGYKANTYLQPTIIAGKTNVYLSTSQIAAYNLLLGTPEVMKERYYSYGINELIPLIQNARIF